ncbi:IS3 family transposase [Streptomyces sp. NPDC058330]|uniref:IS3 family transposase n=1 Tax=Streptomyces sp. NPDC058330 TaxID=3346449 RepID=UPI0036E995DD
MPGVEGVPLGVLRLGGFPVGPTAAAARGGRTRGGGPGVARCPRATRTAPRDQCRALRRAGRVVNEKKVERLMREHRIIGVTRRRRRCLTRQARRAVFAADLIRRDFTAPRPGMRLVGDMTELVTAEGRVYLAICIDLATREVIGWAMADHHRAELPVAALRMAAGRGGLEPGCVMHADCGSEDTSGEFRKEIRKLGMRQSMGRVGSCYDNAAAESWFAVLKAEIGTSVWATRAAARADIFRFIEVEYNRSRLRRHPEFGYITPLEIRVRLQRDFPPQLKFPLSTATGEFQGPATPPRRSSNGRSKARLIDEFARGL